MPQNPSGTLPPLPDPSTPDGEPLAFVGGLTALAAAVLSALIAFGVPLDGTQRAALVALIAVVAPIITAVIGRARVWSPKSVAAVLSAADPGYAATGALTAAPAPPPSPATPGPAAGPPYAA